MGTKVQRWIIVAALLLTALQIVSLWSPPTFGPCLVSPQEHATSGRNDDQQTCPTLFKGSLILLGRVDHFLEQHDKSIVALFTIVLAVSTIGLWLSTAKLWRAGERQMELIAANNAQQTKDMRASIAAAHRTADAAMLSARASIGIELPLLRIEPGYAGFEVSPDIDGIDRRHFVVGRLTILNRGRTKALPVEIRCGWTFGNDLPEEPVYRWDSGFDLDAVVDPQPAEPLEIYLSKLEMDVPADAYGQLTARTSKLWFYVCLVYLDFMKIRHEESFCWRRTEGIGTGRFISDDTAAYNRKT